MTGFPLGARERVRVFTPLGIRFWDAALDRPVGRGLEVWAWLRNGPFEPVRAVSSPSGAYSFHRLPGQIEAEFPGTHGRPWEVGSELEYTIVVADPSGDFLPATFSVTLPLGYPGEFLREDGASPPGGAGRAHLFSSPSRVVPPGAAALRADLEDADRGGPAAWAVVIATLEGRTVKGVADGQGRVLVLAPTPQVERLRLGSPPGSGQGPVAGNAWPVTVRIEYQPSALRYPLEAAVGVLPAPWLERPSLKSVLEEQAPAQITAVDGDAPIDEWDVEIEYGEPLQLRTHDAEGTPLSGVQVHAGASTP